MKNGDMLIADELIETMPTVRNGLISYIPMDGTITDMLTVFRENYYAHTNRDKYYGYFPNQYNYAGKKFRISGWMRCQTAADWTKTASVGFNYQYDNGGTLTSTWKSAVTYTLGNIKEWTYFNVEYAIPSNYKANLRPWFQINITAGTPGYVVEYKDIVYTLDFESLLLSNSNATMTYDGVWTEETTTNLQPNVTVDTGTSITSGSDEFGNYFIKKDNATWYQGLRLPNTKVTAGQTYTWSFEIYSNVAFDLRWDPNCTASNFTGNDAAMTSKTNTVRYDTPNQWKRVYLTVTVDPTATNPYLHHSFCPGNDPTCLNHKIYYRNPQLENKGNPTAYTPTSRSANGIIEIPTNIAARSPFTFNFWIAPNGRNAISNTSKIQFNNFGYFWTYAPCGSDTRKYIWDYVLAPGQSTRVYKDLTSSTPFQIDQYEMITIVFDGTTTKIYRNGTLWDSLASNATCMLGAIDKITITRLEAKVKNLALYNRVLTDAEIKQLYTPPLRLTKDGMLYAQVKERRNDSSNSIIFPFAENADAISSTYKAKTSTNLVFSPVDGVWIGGGTTNRAYNMDRSAVTGVPSNGWDAGLHADAISVSNWSAGYNSGVTDPDIGYHAKWVYEGMDGGPCMKFCDINSRFQYRSGSSMKGRWLGISSTSLGSGTSLGWAVGDTITISWYQKSDTVGKGAEVGIYHKLISTGANSFGSARRSIGVKKANVWERASFSFTIDSDWNLSTDYNIVYVYGYTFGGEGTVWVDKVQVEKRKSLTGYYPKGTTGAGSLIYPKELIDFTEGSIAFWIQPSGPANWARILRIGTYSSPITTDEFRLLYRDEDSYATGYKSISFEIQSKDSANSVSTGYVGRLYNGQWHHVVVTWSNTNRRIRLYVDGVKVGDATPSATFTFPDYDAYTDLVMESGISSFIKDMYVFRRELSDTEAYSLYKTGLRDYKNGRVQIAGKIMEGQVL